MSPPLTISFVPIFSYESLSISTRCFSLSLQTWCWNLGRVDRQTKRRKTATETNLGDTREIGNGYKHKEVAKPAYEPLSEDGRRRASLSLDFDATVDSDGPNVCPVFIHQ